MSPAFFVRRGRFSGADVYSDLVSDNADLTGTHISILAGQNGSGKSRVLASIANLLSYIHQASTRSPLPEHDNRGFCLGLDVSDGVLTNRIDAGSGHRDGKPALLPTRVLALSNLVSDRFHFQKAQEKSAFYFYLGARQSSNLTTTGAVERSVAEALLTMVRDPVRLGTFRRWLSLVVSDPAADVWISFPKLSLGEMRGTLNLKPQELEARARAKLGRSSARSEAADEDGSVHADAVRRLFEGLLKVGEKTERRGVTMSLYSLSGAEAAFFSDEYARLAPYARRLGFGVSASVSFGSPHEIEFSHLSSGEQNILATGSKLISYAEPGCLILIDEPEVSLNVTWQQRYIELVAESLGHAPCCHVLIATHSPHLISNLPMGRASVVTVEKIEERIVLKTVDAAFEGWGSEAVLYQVLGIPSASSNLFYKDMAAVLEHIQAGGDEPEVLDDFLEKASQLDFSGDEALQVVVDEIKRYRQRLQ